MGVVLGVVIMCAFASICCFLRAWLVVNYFCIVPVNVVVVFDSMLSTGVAQAFKKWSDQEVGVVIL